VKSRVGLERFYNLKKESLRVFVDLGGRGIDYGWMVKCQRSSLGASPVPS
jgi:hypothetical protein